MGKYGFVYIWYDRKHKRYYIGCHWGYESDGYVSSSHWMNKAYKLRFRNFKRRILKTNIKSRKELYEEELRWLKMIKPSEIKTKYYNLNISNNEVWSKYDECVKTIGGKISASFTEEKRKQYSLRMQGNKINIGKKYSEERRRKISESQIGRADTRSEEGKEKHRLALSGRPSVLKGKQLNLSDEVRKLISETSKKTSSKEWIIITPNNETKYIKNLKEFCINEGMNTSDYQAFKKMAHKNHKTEHKQYKIALQK